MKGKTLLTSVGIVVALAGRRSQRYSRARSRLSAQPYVLEHLSRYPAAEPAGLSNDPSRCLAGEVFRFVISNKALMADKPVRRRSAIFQHVD
jgi:hypothetical protein